MHHREVKTQFSINFLLPSCIEKYAISKFSIGISTKSVQIGRRNIFYPNLERENIYKILDFFSLIFSKKWKTIEFLVSVDVNVKIIENN